MTDPSVSSESVNSASIDNSSQSLSSTTETNPTGRPSTLGSHDSSLGLARPETKAVHRSKWLVLLVIALAAAGCGTATYFFTRQQEQEDFAQSFEAFATEIIDIAHYESRNIYQTIHSFTATLASFAQTTNATWPFLTLPHFELRGRAVNELAQSLMVSWSPLITVENKAAWEQYAFAHQGWIAEGMAYRPDLHKEYFEKDHTRANISYNVFRFSEGETGEPIRQDSPGVDFGPGQYAPVWQQAPAPHDPSIINFDLLSHPVFQRVYHGAWETRWPVLSEVTDLEFFYGGVLRDKVHHPHSFLLQPIYPYFSQDFSYQVDDVVGFTTAILPWDHYFSNILPKGAVGIMVILHNTCGDHYTYRLDGPEAIYLGQGDQHVPQYNDMEVDAPFAEFVPYNFSDTHAHCEYDLRIFPSSDMEDTYTSNQPILYAAVVVLIFCFTAAVFVLYDCLVQRRQEKVMASAKRTNAIVSSLFPSNVRDRILKDAEAQAEAEMNHKKGSVGFGFTTNKAQLKTFLDDDDDNDGEAKTFDTKPIADLFPETTVLFADIVGFTAWSSVREPSQVFTLLETVYHAFDDIAKRRRVFKVETIGDCYVAVTGLPDPRKDHAVVMSRFARDANQKMNDLTKKLEVSLGPDTGDLSMRMGLHSGPVTAGVLRGDKSRFQLFGDTVNTAARIESTGQRNKIHLSKETADLLVAAGKSHWITERQDKVEAKGKGEIQTYWLNLKMPSGPSTRSGSTDDASQSNARVDVEDTKWVEAGLKTKEEEKGPARAAVEKCQRLVDWNSDVLARLLRQIVARRQASKSSGSALSHSFNPSASVNVRAGTVLDEVKEIIRLPEFDAEEAKNQVDPETIELDKDAVSELHEYVTIIATMYRDNPFHNFEHASHVTMSVVKLLSRIVAPDVTGDDEDKLASTLHDHTYGITSDPLTQFACVYAALIHDVDHQGVPNTQLIKENASIASMYKNKSIAEQNSVDVAWDLLMDDNFSALRNIIYSNDSEHRRFRQLVVNSVMATDIMDKDLKVLRNARWDRAFDESHTDESVRDTVDRKATIVIEHLIQASDVSHTMQHWHIYRKWNERLFHEMYKAFKEGRAEKDPSEFWYTGEIGFFDFYIIPLAKKLKNCGVFGVSSDEYLNYAQKNRQEWENRGAEVVENMIEKYTDMYVEHECKLDDVQDHDNPPLRSQLLRTETFDYIDDGELDSKVKERLARNEKP